MSERVILSIGTKKGLFVAEAPTTRSSFALRGPFGPGVGVYATLIDTRGTPRLYASSCNAFFGMKVLLSTDLGKTFKETKSAPAFPKEDGRALANIWSLEAGGDKKDLWCGVEPASLFKSDDGGDSWEMVPGISNHAHARKWQPGNGGLCLHTILRDGKRVHLGISTGGHYLSEDGGATFTASNKGIGAGFAPDPYPEFGQCVHKIAAPAVRLWLPDGRSSAQRRHDLCRAARAVDAHLSGRRSGGLAQRGRRRLVGAACPRSAEEGELLHGPARRDGHRRAQVARALLRDHDRAALDRARRRGGMELPVRLAPADPLRESRGGLSLTTARLPSRVGPWTWVRARPSDETKVDPRAVEPRVGSHAPTASLPACEPAERGRTDGIHEMAPRHRTLAWP